MVQRPLHLGVKLLVFQFFARNPFGRCHQRGFAFKVAAVPFQLGLPHEGVAVAGVVVAVGIFAVASVAEYRGVQVSWEVVSSLAGAAIVGGSLIGGPVSARSVGAD